GGRAGVAAHQTPTRNPQEAVRDLVFRRFQAGVRGQRGAPPERAFLVHEIPAAPPQRVQSLCPVRTKKKTFSRKRYFLNLLLDTTIGIGILYGYLRVVGAAVRRLRLSEMQSGHYGDPPKISAWIKQSFAFLCALAAMKLTVLLLLHAFPVLESFGRW
ncbi:MAG: vacuolar membrane protein-domain-containing protein, partial [Olpidium bornovanus]